MDHYYYFSFVISHGKFITTLLSDLHDTELDTMAELSDMCNGAAVDFYLNDRPRVEVLNFKSFNNMVRYVERTLVGTTGVKISVIARYIMKMPSYEMEDDDDDASIADDGDIFFDSTCV